MKKKRLLWKKPLRRSYQQFYLNLLLFWRSFKMTLSDDKEWYDIIEREFTYLDEYPYK